MSAGPVELLRRAGADGHTWLPRGLVEPAAGAAALGAALARGELVEVVGTGRGGAAAGVALADVAEAEELLADGLRGLAAAGLLEVVAGGARALDADGPRAGGGPGPGGGAPEVLRCADVHLWTVAEAAERVGDLPEGVAVRLDGDPAALGPAGPGRVLADVVDAGVCPVRAAPDPGRDALDRACAALRAGRLPAPDPADRSFVVVPVGSDAAAAHRAGQVARDSVPRALGIPAADVAVLVPLVRGPAGAVALAGALPGLRVLDVAAAAGRRWPAVVLVLPGRAAGVLSRALLVSAAGCAERHLTVVHGAGPELARAVAGVPARPRRTRLAALLRGGG